MARGQSRTGPSIAQTLDGKRRPDPGLLERIHHLLYKHVEEAVDPVVHLEEKWTRADMIRRIVRYIYKSASSEDLLKQPSGECVKNLVENAMHGYSAACQDKDWFFDIELGPAFVSTAWEILRTGRHAPRFDWLQEKVELEYEDKLDRIMNERAMREAAKKSFKDDTISHKVFQALYKSFDVALDDAVIDNRPISDERKMELFMKKWINESMSRCWNSVPNSEQVITENSASRLFSHLVAPFGNDHPFSCIPNDFFPSGERPPVNWPYIRIAVRQMFESWKRHALAPPSKKRKTGRSSEVREAAIERDVAPAEDEVPEEEVPVEEEGPPSENEDALGEGHPHCTSQEDCVGGDADRLVQHIMQGKPGDVYCEACWLSFREQNGNLEGTYQDTGLPFQ